MSVIPDTWKAEIGELWFKARVGQKVSKTLSHTHKKSDMVTHAVT
jgi:hypothetical protein